MIKGKCWQVQHRQEEEEPGQRFGRHQEQAGAKAKLLCDQRNFDLKSASSFVLLFVEAAIAAWERPDFITD